MKRTSSIKSLVAGSYERFLFAYEVKPLGSEVHELARAFSFPAHKGPVKCIVGAGPYVASGGADDTVHIYNAEAGKDLGFLMNPGDGAVTAVAFYTPSGTAQPTHLLSGAADGSISVWAAGGTWDCLKVLKGHKKDVTSLSVHPNGLLALSTARDDMLRMWNMSKGRSQYKTKIPPGTEAVSFSPNGDMYALLSGSKVTAHNVLEEGGTAATFELEKRGLCFQFLSNEVLVVGGEDGVMRILDLRADKAQQSFQVHATRVRGVAPLLPERTSSSEAADSAAQLVGTAASDGLIRLWDLRSTGAAGSSRAQPLSEASTSARLTCLTALQPGIKASVSVVVPQETAGKARTGSKGAGEPKQPRKRREREEAPGAAGQAARKGPIEGQGRPKDRMESNKAAAGQEEGVVLRRKAETVVEFPDVAVKKKKKNPAKGAKGK